MLLIIIEFNENIEDLECNKGQRQQYTRLGNKMTGAINYFDLNVERKLIFVSYRDGDHYCGYLTDYEFDVFVLNIGYQEHYQIDGLKEYYPCIDDPYTIDDFIPTVVDDIHDKMCEKTNERETDYSRTCIYLLNKKRTTAVEDMTTHNVKKTINRVTLQTLKLGQMTQINDGIKLILKRIIIFY